MGLANFYNAQTKNLQEFGRTKVRPVLKNVKQNGTKLIKALKTAKIADDKGILGKYYNSKKK